MIRELADFFRHRPAMNALRRRLGPLESHVVMAERLDRAGLGRHRRALVRDLRGRVLEIGCGTGGLFPYYSAEVEVTAVEPDPSYRGRAVSNARSGPARITVVPGWGERLPCAEQTFDAVVLTMVLCSVASVREVLAEAARVLKPCGQLRMIEHVRSDRPVAGLLMDLFNPVWRAISSSGCNMNRDLAGVLTETGFSVVEEHSFQVFCPGLPAFPMKWLSAGVSS